MRTTIDLPDELFREVKLRAIHDGLRLKDLFRHFVEQGLVSGSPSLERDVRRKRSDLAIIHTTSGATLPDFDNAELNRLLDEEDADKVETNGNRSS